MGTLSTIYPSGGVKSVQRIAITMTGNTNGTPQTVDTAIAAVNPAKTTIDIIGGRATDTNGAVSLQGGAPMASIELINNGTTIRMRREAAYVLAPWQVAIALTFLYNVQIVEYY